MLGARTVVFALALALLASLATSVPGTGDAQEAEQAGSALASRISPADRFGVARPDKAAPPEAAKDRLLVRFDESASPGERDSVLQRHGFRRGRAVGRTGFVVAHSRGKSPEEARKGLRREKSVTAVSLDYQRRVDQTTQTHDRFSWNQSQFSQTRIERAWQVTTGASDLVIAVVDTGVRASHQELAGRVLGGRDFVNLDSNANDDHGHGTFVASIAAADRANNGGIAGVAGSVKVLPVKVLNRDGAGYDSDIAAGVTWAADQGAEIINLSFGGPAADPALDSAVSYARSQGSLVVAAAGNEGSGTPLYPAAIPGVLTVGATGYQGELAYFSSYGDHIDLVAPGVELWGAGIGDDSAYVRLSGTSFSAPFVSGVAALVLTKYRSFSADQVTARLRGSADDVGPQGIDAYYGRGLVDVAAALGEWAGNPRPPVVDRGFGGDDHAAGALPLQWGATAALASGDDWSWYRWTADTSRLELAVQPSGPAADQRDGRGLDPILAVLDSDLRLLTYQDAGLVFDSESVSLSVTHGQTYYLAVANYNGSGGTYRMLSATGGSTQGESGQAWARAVSPAPRSGDLVANSDFTVTFARSIQSSSITADTVRVRDGITGADVPAARSYDTGSRVLTVDPDAPLLPNRPYRLDISGVRDTAGNTLSGLRVPAATGTIGRGFTSRQPVRVLDTRSGIGAPQARVGAGEYVDLKVAGVGGVPTDTEAVVLNIAAVSPTRATHVSVVPTPATGAAPPATASLNLVAGEIRSNQVTVKVGAGGKVRLFNNSGEVDLVGDLGGWYRHSSGDGFEPVSPARILDTRTGLGAPKARVGSGKGVDLRIHGRGGVPASATGVVFNLVGVSPSRGTFLEATPTPLVGGGGDKVANVNLRAGEVVPNQVSVPIGADGRVRIYNHSGDVHLIADVMGYFSPHGRAAFAPVDPVRLLDTRDGTGGSPGPVGADDHRDLAINGNATLSAERPVAVVFNLTGVRPTASTWVAAVPTPVSGSPRPTTATLNLVHGEVRPNATTIPPGSQGRVRFYNYVGEVDLVADAVGYFQDVGYGA